MIEWNKKHFKSNQITQLGICLLQDHPSASWYKKKPEAPIGKYRFVARFTHSSITRFLYNTFKSLVSRNSFGWKNIHLNITWSSFSYFKSDIMYTLQLIWKMTFYDWKCPGKSLCETHCLYEMCTYFTSICFLLHYKLFKLIY